MPTDSDVTSPFFSKRAPAGPSALAGCQTDSNGRREGVGRTVTFTFPDMDRMCGDCSMFKASITLAPGFPAGQPAHFELLATVNSSDNGDTWRMRLSFRRADGSEVFSLPPANWWMGVAIAQKDAPQEWVFAGDPNYPQLSEVPSNFAEAVSVHLYADC